MNFKNLSEIVVSILVWAMIIAGCTKEDKKCMPLTSSSKKAKALAWEAQAVLADGFTAKAIDLLEQALELDSNFVAANLLYGQNAGLGNIKRHQYFLKAERNMGNMPEAEQHMVKSYLALEKGDRETVINELKAIITLYPEDKYMLRLLAVRYYGFGQYDNALEWARKSYQADTAFATIVNYQGYILAAMGKNDEAEKWYQKSIKMNPGVPLYYNNYGALLRGTGRIDEAIEMHRKAIDMGADFTGHLYLGHCYTIRGDYVLGRENYSKAFDLSLNNAQKNSQLTFIVCSYLYEGNITEAIRAFDRQADFLKQAGGMDLELISSIANKGFCLLLYGDHDGGEKTINEASALIASLNLTETDRRNYEKYAITWKGWFHAISGESAEAQKSLDEFRSSLKNDTETNAMKSALNSFQGMVAFSKKNWKESVSFLSLENTPVTNYFKGLAYMNAGEREKAAEVLALLADYKYVGLQAAIVKYLSKVKLDELR